MGLQTADLYYAQPLNNGIFTACEYNFERNTFCRLYEIHLSIKDLKNLAEFRLSQILYLCTQNMFAPQTSDLLEKMVLIFLYNFHRDHNLQTLKIKKVIAENQCEKHKN